MIGFFLVLFLLVFVAAFGYYGMRQGVKTSDASAELVDVSDGVTNLQGLTFAARLTATEGVLNRNEKYQKDRQEIDTKVKTLYDKLKIEIAKVEGQEKNSTDIDEIYNKYIEFAKKDDQWYKIERDRKVELTTLVAKAEEIYANLKELSRVINEAMLKPEESKEIDGHRFVSESRTVQLQQCERCINTLQELRRSFYQYFSQTESEAKQNIHSDINRLIEEFKTNYGKVAEKLTTDAGKEISKKIKDALTIWQKSFSKNIEILQDQDKLDGEQTILTNEMNAIREIINKNLSDQVAKLKEKSEDTNRKVSTAIPAIALIAFIVGVLISIVLNRNITRGLRVAMESINHVVLEGDLTADLPADVLSRHDEIGDMARVAGAVLSDYRSIDSMANSLAIGDWRLTVNEKGSLDTMNQNLNRMLDQVNQALREINESVKQVSTGSGEVSSAAQTLSSGAQESSASLEEITASMSEISSQTRANAQSASEARDLAHSATKAAADGQEAMKQMNEAMVRITKNSNEIQRVIKVIDDIAFQTNLLA
jgi:methyl-accepting chemotaxis protein